MINLLSDCSRIGKYFTELNSNIKIDSMNEDTISDRYTYTTMQDNSVVSCTGYFTFTKTNLKIQYGQVSTGLIPNGIYKNTEAMINFPITFMHKPFLFIQPVNIAYMLDGGNTVQSHTVIPRTVTTTYATISFNIFYVITQQKGGSTYSGYPFASECILPGSENTRTTYNWLAIGH